MTNRADINKVETYVATVVQQFDTTITISKESSFYDLFIRFYTFTVLIKILEILAAFEAEQSYANVEMPEIKYDKLLNRWLFTRESGNSTTFMAGIVFDNDLNVFNIRTTDIFKTGGRSFKPLSNQTIARPSYTKQVIDSDTAEYMIKIAVIATESGADVTANIGDTVSIPYTTLNGFIRANVDSDLVFGANPESNAAAFNRLQESITIESFVNRRSINGQFARELPGVVRSHVVIGYTEPEMYRDGFYTQLPEGHVKLLFSTKNNVSLVHKDSFGNVVTRFFYNRNPTIVYHLKLPLGVNAVNKLSTDVWDIHPSGSYSMDVAVTMASLENPQGFVDDIGVSVSQASFNPISGVQTGEMDLGDINSSYITAYTSTKPYSVPGTDSFLVHMGGFTDIYVDVHVNRISRKFKVPLDSGGVLEIPDVYKPLLKMHSVLDSELKVVDFAALNVLDFKTRYTARDTTQILLDPGLVGTEVTIDFTYAPDVQTVDKFILEPNTAIPGDQSQVRFKSPIFVSLIAEVSVSGESADIANRLRTAFFTYINNVRDISVLPISKIMAAMDQAIPELAGILSFNMFATQHLPDGTTKELETDESITPVQNLDMGVSERTIKFLPESAEFIFV